MPLPYLHLFHPPESVAPHLAPWLAQIESVLRGDANWDGCIRRRVEYDREGGFNVGTEVDNVRRTPGPVIFLYKAQQRFLNRFRAIIGRQISVYAIAPACAEDIWQACEDARKAYEAGEPHIAIREAIAFLIVSKLARQDKWGGASLYKNFLWAELLPKGGFPKGLCSDRDIISVADTLCNHGVLGRKTSESKTKYALGEKRIIDAILSSKSFAVVPSLRKYFDKSGRSVPARVLDYRD